MIVKNIEIEQALHGYSNGHRLLQSSYSISDSGKKKMLALSDLSGGEIYDGFEQYYTGYDLDSEHVVLACSWYANEMSRPGCVYTHSLIFHIKDLLNMNGLAEQVLTLFVRPDLNTNLDQYASTIVLDMTSNEIYNENKMKYLFWCIQGNNKPLVVFRNRSDDFIKELMCLFLAQRDLMGGKLSFCTGSFSLRSYNGKFIDLQVSPRQIPRGRLMIGEQAYEAKDFDSIKSYPLWVNKAYEILIKDNFNDFKRFTNQFSNQFNTQSFFSSFVKLYVGSNAIEKSANIGSFLEMSSAIFEDKELICSEICELYAKGTLKNWCGVEDEVKTLHFLLQNRWLDASLLSISSLIKNAYRRNMNGFKELFKYILQKEDDIFIESILKEIAETVSVESFVFITDMEYAECGVLLTLNNEFALCVEIWKKSKGFQQNMISCLRQREEIKDKEIIKTIIENTEFDLSEEIYRVYKDECVDVFWDYYLNYYKQRKLNGIKRILKKNPESNIEIIRSNLDKRDNLLAIIDIIDPYYKNNQKFKQDEIRKLFDTFQKERASNKDKESLALFLVPLCIIEDYLLDEDIAKFTFDIVNRLLSIQEFPEDMWNELQKKLPEVAFYNSWDRCKRLRKGFRKKGYSFLHKEKKDDDLPTHLL